MNKYLGIFDYRTGKVKLAIVKIPIVMMGVRSSMSHKRGFTAYK